MVKCGEVWRSVQPGATCSCLTLCRTLVTVTHDGDHTTWPVAYSACYMTRERAQRCFFTFSRLWGWWAGWRRFDRPLSGDVGRATLGVGHGHTFPVFTHSRVQNSFREAEQAAHACRGNSTLLCCFKNTVMLRTQG